MSNSGPRSVFAGPTASADESLAARSDGLAERLAEMVRDGDAAKGLDTFSKLANLRPLMAKKPTPAQFRAQAEVFKALGHPGRLLMVDELSRGERCVCELTALVGSEMATVSRHLSVLRHAGIVEDEKRGAQVFYRLKTPCVMNFFQCVTAVREGREERVATMV